MVPRPSLLVSQGVRRVRVALKTTVFRGTPSRPHAGPMSAHDVSHGSARKARPRKKMTRRERETAYAMFTLYVASDKEDASRLCTGSVLCLGLVNKLADPSSVQVVDCDRREARPVWCRGTPTLQDEETGVVREGSDAFYSLQELALSDATRQGAAASAKQRRGAAAHSSARAATMMASHVQLRPEGERRRVQEVDEGGGATADPSSFAAGGEESNPWESRVDDSQMEEAESSGKLKSDDFAKAMQDRQAQLATQQPPGAAGGAPPPLAPLNEKGT